MTTIEKTDFIRNIIAKDREDGKNLGQVVTRFPPEPNGFLHIGHAKSICLNFGVAAENDGTCHLRFDDTNPSKEESLFVDAIMADVRWLGFDWHDKRFFTSNYFEDLYGFAVELIQQGKAYVCDLTSDEIREYRGTLTEAGKNSPCRDRSISENIDLFKRMRNGEFADGSYVVRAKINMASPNMNMRDPAIYRIRKVTHHRTGDQWCVYPMYDFAHCLSDAIEGITHSLCTLEFEDHRPLYDWVLEQFQNLCHPQQIEFSRLNLTYTVMSKRKLLQLVEGGHVDGWDDPRMCTISGLRRRGYSPKAIRDFCHIIGISKKDSRIDVGVLENCLREDLNDTSPRVMGVLRPLKVVITNYPDELVEEMEGLNHPKNPDMGTRKLPFAKEIYIEQDDFMENPPKKFFRLGIGREVRLRYAYLVTCHDVIKDEKSGEIIEVHCTYDPETRGGSAPDGRKVKGTIHWVSARHAVKAEIRLYDRLFNCEEPDGDKETDFITHLNSNSKESLVECALEPGLAEAKGDIRYQFERKGYFCLDSVDSKEDHLVFNMIVNLRDTWAKRR